MHSSQRRFAATSTRTLVAVLSLTTIWGCQPDPAGLAPDVTAVFAKPVSQVARAATFALPSTGYSLTSDGLGSYADGVCGVLARVFQLGADYQDGNMQLDNPRAKDRSCVQRKLTITYPDNTVTQSNTGNINIRLMGTVAGGPEPRSMNIAIAGSGVRCAQLGFGNNAGGQQVTVTRTSSTSWNVSASGVEAACVSPSGSTSVIPNFSINFNVTLN